MGSEESNNQVAVSHQGKHLAIHVARTAGMCFGVKMAVDKAVDTSKSGDNVFMLGNIVHNEHVVEKLSREGIKVVNHIDDIDKDGTLLIRAHGAVPQTYEDAQARNLKVVDATCPMVLEIHEIVRELQKEGYRIVIIGDHDHQEVKGIAGQVKDPMVVALPEEVDSRVPRILKKLGVVVQSTQNILNVQSIVAKLVPRAHDLKVINTICGPTKSHQKELITMPERNDVMIIVGSFISANTKRLTSISKELNTRTYQVESASDIQPSWFADAKSVGVTAGASTPDWVINEVVECLKAI